MSGERKVGVVLDFSNGSKKALWWAIDNLLKEGDYLIVIHVMPSELFDEHHGISDSLESGSALIPLHDFRNPEMMNSYGLEVDMEVVNMLNAIPSEKMVSAAAKLYWGDAAEKLCQAREDLNLNSIVMRNRSLNPIERIALRSLSNIDYYYVLIMASCPVITIYWRCPMRSDILILFYLMSLG